MGALKRSNQLTPEKQLSRRLKRTRRYQHAVNALVGESLARRRAPRFSGLQIRAARLHRLG